MQKRCQKRADNAIEPIHKPPYQKITSEAGKTEKNGKIGKKNGGGV